MIVVSEFPLNSVIQRLIDIVENLYFKVKIGKSSGRGL